MRAIAWRWAAAIGWLFLVPVLVPERLGASIGPEAGGFGSGAAIALVLVPKLRELNVRWALLLVLPFFLGVQLLTGDGVGGAGVPELVELGYVAGAIVLATGIGRRMSSLEDTLENLAGPEDWRAEPFEMGQEEIYREIRRARRYARPAALLTLSASGVEAQPGSHLTREVLQEITERYAAAQVGRLLLHGMDAAAVITRRDDRFVILLPETDSEAARKAARRIAAEAADRWGLELRCGIASFPDQEVTFEGLLEHAEAELRAAEHGSSSTRTRVGRPRKTGFRIAKVGERSDGIVPSRRSGA